MKKKIALYTLNILFGITTLLMMSTTNPVYLKISMPIIGLGSIIVGLIGFLKIRSSKNIDMLKLELALKELQIIQRENELKEKGIDIPTRPRL